ncbi:MAG: outer membrane lipoprotein-sorting protein [Endomicrobiales bacterium]|nr:outer membrane lipoprotein-sorting protein [Endomicrobiales bacterium]
MKIKTVLIVLSIMTALYVKALYCEMLPKDVIDKSYKATRLPGMEAVSEMTIIDSKGRERVRKIAQVAKLYDNGDTQKKLVRFLAPADVKGTGLLTYDYEKKDDDIWLYLPALRKVRRIVSSEKAKSFMGSEFSYADMTPPILDDFTYKMLEAQTVRDIPCYVVETKAKDDDIADENGFLRKISYIGKQDFVIRKAVYYDQDNELLKELNMLEVKEMDKKNGKYHPMHITMENKQNGRKSVLKTEKVILNNDIKDDFFTVRYLEHQ